jgi:D-sedoheptulose 7-phosphate isomerase
LIFGNGGSAAEAQHFAAELVNRFLKDRPALAAISLSTDTSALTSIANDSSFERVFSRQIEALGREGDVAVALSTSGRSPNILKALSAARRKKLLSIALTGKDGEKLRPLADFLLDVPSADTPRVQEVHLVLLHLMAGTIEEALAGARRNRKRRSG